MVCFMIYFVQPKLGKGLFAYDVLGLNTEEDNVNNGDNDDAKISHLKATINFIIVFKDFLKKASSLPHIPDVVRVKQALVVYSYYGRVPYRSVR